MTRVLIVDDSAVMREMLREILSEDPEIEVAGVAEDPLVARDMIKALNPDVITLDIEMPRMDGLEFLERLMRLRPMGVVMISSHVQPGAILTIRALEIGAVDVVGKPSVGQNRSLFDLGPEIISKVKAAARVRFEGPSRERPAPLRNAQPNVTGIYANRVIAIGASTGGVQAINHILPSMPVNCPPILIAQHMPAGFTRSFAERLDRNSAIRVVEAENGMKLDVGHAYVAPGDFHLEIARSGLGLRCTLEPGKTTDKHVPSVDVLLTSVAKVAGGAGIGAVLTGMGSDGAKGLKEMKMAGAATVCQDEASSLIYGMPKVAAALGGADKQLPLSKITAFLIEESCKPAHRSALLSPLARSAGASK